MGIIRFMVLSVLMLAFAIPASATCSVCITDVTITQDDWGFGTTTQTGAECRLDINGDIADCRVVVIGGIPQCASGQKVSTYGEYFVCPPWDCPTILPTGAKRPILLGL